MLKHRLITGILVLAFFVGMLLFAPVWALVVMLVGVYALAQLEYCEMCKAKGYELERIGIFVCGLLFLGATLFELNVFNCRNELWRYFNITEYVPLPMVVTYFVPAFLVIQTILRRKTEKAAECLGLSLLGIWYVAMLTSFMVHIALEWNSEIPVYGKIATTNGRLLLIFFILLVKMSDIGAYTFGRLWGHKIKRKLIPEISPKKSIPGLFGAYVGSVLVAVIVAWILHACNYDSPVSIHVRDFTYGKAIALGILMATVGVLGDLAESLLKRSFGVKDSSGRFPGMGGFLDILDSLLFAAPFMYFFVVWFL